MRVTLDTGPTVEPVTMGEVKEHLRIDSGDISDSLIVYQSLKADSYLFGNYNGTSVNVKGARAVVVLNVGTVVLEGTLDVKIQESVDDEDWTDWSGGDFDQVTLSNDNALYQMGYTGDAEYIRVNAVVGVNSAEFSVSVNVSEPTLSDDEYIERLITVAREEVEQYTNRALITQTWKAYLDDWPACGFIELPKGNLQSVTHVKYTDSDGDQSTWSTDDYEVDTASVLGRILLAYGESYPADTLDVINPIEIEFICGYGDAASDLPEKIRQAVLVTITDYYENRETMNVGISTYKENKLASRLMDRHRILTT